MPMYSYSFYKIKNVLRNSLYFEVCTKDNLKLYTLLVLSI